MESSLSDLYGKIAGPWVSQLLGELLVLGFFLVIYSYIKLIIANYKTIKWSEFVMRLLLLGSVSLFVFYVDITYFLTYELTPTGRVIEIFKDFSYSEQSKAKVLLLILVPIDFLVVTVLVSMFAVLSIESFNNSKPRKILKKGLGKVVLSLLFFAFLFHFLNIIWWSILSVFETLYIDDLLYHLLFSFLHLLGYFVFKRRLKKDNSRAFAVFYFITLIISTYISRTWVYIDKLLN